MFSSKQMNQKGKRAWQFAQNNLLLAAALAAWYGETMPHMTDEELGERIALYYWNAAVIVD